MSELIYGRRAVLETLRAGRRRIYRLWIEGETLANLGGTLGEIVAAAQAKGVAVRAVKGGLFDKLAQQQAHAQGVALEVDDYPYVDLDEILAHAGRAAEPPLLLILDHVQDPQNLGTLVRTAEAMAVHGILLPDRRAARVTPAVSNASAGAVELMRVAQVTNLNRTIDELKRLNVWVAGLDSGDEAPVVEPAALRGGLALVWAAKAAAFLA
jgi:23S rRNA (guanosine2251-2'-O)-methyltransferase